MTLVRIARAAQRNLTTIVHHLAATGGQRPARDFLEAFENVRRRLEVYPEAYALRAPLGGDIRAITISPYLVIHQYRSRHDEVLVLRVLHGRRDLGPGFRQLR